MSQTKAQLLGNVVDDFQINAQNELRLADSDSSNYVALKSPATVGTNVVWTLPASDGTNGQVLSTNGSGVLAWANDAAVPGAGTITAAMIASGLQLVTINDAQQATLAGTGYCANLSSNTHWENTLVGYIA